MMLTTSTETFEVQAIFSTQIRFFLKSVSCLTHFG